MRNSASGFCVFNDASIAIAWLLEQGYERIAYVDVDVHHGDGVQAAFYDDPRVLTVSVHQTPLTLFPGTGFPEETGDPQKALGSAVNLALPERHRRLRLAARVHGRRPERAARRSPRRSWSPRTAATPTTRTPSPTSRSPSTASAPATPLMHDLAHELCDGRWIALGGGGYGLVRCVPRAWTHLIAEVSGDRLDPATEIPQSWRDDVVARGLRARPPTHMTEGGYTGFTRVGPVHRVAGRPGDHAHPHGHLPLLRPRPGRPP